MKFRKHLLGQSIVWLGVLYSTSDRARAETQAPFVPELPPQESHQTTEDAFKPQANPYDNCQATDSLANKLVANIAPVEIFPQPPERIQGTNLGEQLISTQGISKAHAFAEAASKQQLPSEMPSDLMPGSDDALEGEPNLDRVPLVDAPEAIEENGFDATDDEEPVVDETNDEEATASVDPELGNLRLQERSLTPQPATSQPRPETVFLVGRLNLFRSDNILLDDFDPVNDQLFQVGVSVVAIPSLGRQTQLIASVGGNLTRYSDLSDLNYNNLELQLGIQQGLSPRTYGEISWTNQQYFAADSGDRFLNDHSLRFTVAHREQLASQLTLDGFYQLRFSFTNPTDRSRISNTLGASLNYNFQQNFGVGLDYQFVLTHFTQQEREDGYHQLIAQLNYNLSRNNRVSLFGGFSFGRSSDSNLDFNSSILGVAFSTNVALF